MARIFGKFCRMLFIIRSKNLEKLLKSPDTYKGKKYCVKKKQQLVLSCKACQNRPNCFFTYWRSDSRDFYLLFDAISGAILQINGD